MVFSKIKSNQKTFIKILIDIFLNALSYLVLLHYKVLYELDKTIVYHKIKYCTSYNTKKDKDYRIVK